MIGMNSLFIVVGKCRENKKIYCYLEMASRVKNGTVALANMP